LAGTSFAPDLRGAILCLEDVGEEAYRLDRLFWQLTSAGLLRECRGIVLGALTACTPAGGRRHSARRVLEGAIAALGLPAIAGAAFGHGRRNVALPVGVRARLDAGAGTLTLLEPAVRLEEPRAVGRPSAGRRLERGRRDCREPRFARTHGAA